MSLGLILMRLMSMGCVCCVFAAFRDAFDGLELFFDEFERGFLEQGRGHDFDE